MVAKRGRRGHCSGWSGRQEESLTLSSRVLHPGNSLRRGGLGTPHGPALGSLPLLLQHVGLIQLLVPVLLSDQPGAQQFLELDPRSFSPHISCRDWEVTGSWEKEQVEQAATEGSRVCWAGTWGECLSSVL